MGAWELTPTTYSSIDELEATPWHPQLPFELHSVWIKRVSGGTAQSLFIQVFNAVENPPPAFPGVFSEEHMMPANNTYWSFPVWGYRFFSLVHFTLIGGDDAVVEFKVLGNGGP